MEPSTSYLFSGEQFEWLIHCRKHRDIGHAILRINPVGFFPIPSFKLWKRQPWSLLQNWSINVFPRLERLEVLIDLFFLIWKEFCFPLLNVNDDVALRKTKCLRKLYLGLIERASVPGEVNCHILHLRLVSFWAAFFLLSLVAPERYTNHRHATNSGHFFKHPLLRTFYS